MNPCFEETSVVCEEDDEYQGNIDFSLSSVSSPDSDPDDQVTHDQQPNKITEKRICRSETPSESNRVEQDAHKEDAKRTRTEFRTLRERKKPGYLDDYVMNIALTSSQVWIKAENLFVQAI